MRKLLHQIRFEVSYYRKIAGHLWWCGVIALCLWILMCIWGGGTAAVRCRWILPDGFPPTIVFYPMWALSAFLWGVAMGIVLFARNYACIGRRDTILRLTAAFVLMILWYPLFFGLKLFTISMILLALSVILCLMAIAGSGNPYVTLTVFLIWQAIRLAFYTFICLIFLFVN